MAFPQVIDITKKGKFPLTHVTYVWYTYVHTMLWTCTDGPSPRETLANQLASVLEMRRRKQQVSPSTSRHADTTPLYVCVL